MLIVNPVIRYPPYYGCKKWTLVTIISIDLMLALVTIIILIERHIQLDHRMDQIEAAMVTVDTGGDLSDAAAAATAATTTISPGGFDRAMITIINDKEFTVAELAVNLAWLMIGLMGLIAVIKEHFRLVVAYAITGAGTVLSSVYFWCETKSEQNFLHLISRSIFFLLLLILVTDLYQIDRQRRRFLRARMPSKFFV